MYPDKQQQEAMARFEEWYQTNTLKTAFNTPVDPQMMYHWLKNRKDQLLLILHTL